MFGMVALTLIVIFPHGDLVRRVIEAPQGLLTATYLNNLLRTEPDNPQLRLLLARNQLQAGEPGKLRATLTPLLTAADGETRRSAIWLLWQADARRMEKLPTLTREREILALELRQRLAQLTKEDWPPAEKAQLAMQAFALGDKALGLAIFRELGNRVGNNSPQWIVEGGREALAQGEYRAAAEFYLLAAERAPNLNNEREYLLKALQSMVAGNATAEALQLAENYFERFPRLADDTAVLIELVKYARAARRPDLADRYARRLLRLALLEQWRREEQKLAHWGAAPARVGGQSEPGLPFDDKIYTLGFEAFLDNRKLEDAWKVAASAVRQAPDNLVWRERLAKVAEWSGRPAQALENWLYLARSGNRPDAWQAVLRLAPGLFDDRALREALQRELAVRPGDEKLIRELAAIYERLADPEGGRRFLEGRYAALGRSWLLVELAGVAERMGDEDGAIAYWRRYLAKEKATAAIATRIATLMLLRGHGEEALRVLQSASDAADAQGAFWRLQGNAARSVQQDSAAIAAYRKLISLADAEENDYETLRTLLLDAYPLEAARVAAAQWRRFGSTAALLHALGGFDSRNATAESGRLLGEIKKDQLPALRRIPEFLRYTGRYHSQRGEPVVARRDLELALQLAPDDSQIRQAWLWLLIDGGDGKTLLATMQANEPRWQGDSTLHDTLAAAWLTLSRPQLALNRYLTPNLASHRDDFLWLMNYADALEQNGEVDRAWQLRAHLMRAESRGVKRQDWLKNLDQDAARRVARARLSIAQNPGDPGLAALRQLLRLDRETDGKPGNEAVIVAASWLQNAGEHSAERGWLWQRLAKNAARPLWAEISMALAEDDRAAAGQLLEKHADALPRSDRINAAMRLGLVRQAQSDAFETLSDQPHDDELHLQLAEALLKFSDHAGGTVVRRRIGDLDENEQAARWHLALVPDLSLDLSAGRLTRRDRNPDEIGVTPHEHFNGVQLNWQRRDSTTRLSYENRSSFATYRPLFLEHRQRFDERLEWRLFFGRQLPASDTTALRLAGMRDRQAAGLSYKLTQRDTFDAEFGYERFFAQTGSALGSARRMQFEWRHALRLDPRDLEASMFWSKDSYRRNGALGDPALLPLRPASADPEVALDGSFFVPESYRYYGVRLSTDTRFADEYTRAWRPYASVARTWNSALGNGYDLSFGVAGSVLGADHLRLAWSLGKGGNISGGLVRQLELSYRLHF